MWRQCAAVAGLMAGLLLVTPAFGGARADAWINARFAEAARSGALLRLLLQQMPKGGDLHRHGEGALYVEDMMRWAAARDGCLVLKSMTMSAGPCMAPDSVPLRNLETRDTDLYNDAIEALSMGRHGPDTGDPTISGHERFFRTFRGFAFGVRGERAQVLAANREQAALDHTLYIELMAGTDFGRDMRPVFATGAWDEADMPGRFERLLPIITEVLPHGRADADATERAAAELNGCETARPGVGCAVTVRYLPTVGREAEPEQVFGRLALAFALVDADPRFVGVNIAQPEDGPISLRDYSLHMRMFAFLKTRYPRVPLSLHAGELTLGLTPPRDLRFHIREAVEIAGARRIGHGVDIAYEEGAVALLQRMAREHIAVEINLTSNDVILGIKPGGHPLPLYRAAGVPVVLATDDPGVSRGDLTQEYQRAMTEHGLRYTDLRQISRDSLSYSFLEGESLWDASSGRMQPVCAGRLQQPSSDCAALLARSAKAREQWRLEQSLAAFEAALPRIVKSVAPQVRNR